MCINNLTNFKLKKKTFPKLFLYYMCEVTEVTQNGMIQQLKFTNIGFPMTVKPPNGNFLSIILWPKYRIAYFSNYMLSVKYKIY